MGVSHGEKLPNIENLVLAQKVADKAYFWTMFSPGPKSSEEGFSGAQKVPNRQFLSFFRNFRPGEIFKKDKKCPSCGNSPLESPLSWRPRHGITSQDAGVQRLRRPAARAGAEAAQAALDVGDAISAAVVEEAVPPATKATAAAAGGYSNPCRVRCAKPFLCGSLSGQRRSGRVLRPLRAHGTLSSLICGTDQRRAQQLRPTRLVTSPQAPKETAWLALHHR